VNPARELSRRQLTNSQSLGAILLHAPSSIVPLEALVIDRYVPGDEHPGVGVVLNNLANLLQRKWAWPGLSRACSFRRRARNTLIGRLADKRLR
jgi:hypothetical protein